MGNKKKYSANVKGKSKVKTFSQKRRIIPKNIVIPAGMIVNSAPNSIELFEQWYELTIGIGNDHTAILLIDDDALAALEKLDPEVAIF